jgi:general stress protein CsbA
MSLTNYEINSEVRPEYSLYSIKSITLATAIGSVLAGVILLSSNLKKVNREDEVLQTYIFGIVTLVVLVFASLKIPFANKIPDFIFYLIQIGMVQLFANYKLKQDLLTHEKHQGPFYSQWRAAGISVLFTLAIFVIILGISLLNREIQKVDYGNNQAVYYKLDATKDDAIALGNYLRKVNFFDSAGHKNVFISKEADEYKITFPVKNSVVSDKKILDAFSEFRKLTIENVFPGKKLKLILSDSKGNTLKEISD